MMITIFHKTTPALAAIAGLALLGLAGEAAAAASPVVVTSSNVTAPVGGSAQVTFDFDFGTGYTTDGFALDLGFDKSLLDLTTMNATYQGAPIDMGAALNAAGTLFADPSAPAGWSALWYAFDAAFNPLPSLTASGHATLTLGFTLLPAFAAGDSTPVSVAIAAGLVPAGESLVVFTDQFGAQSLVTATAVPLPGAFVLALGASGFLFGRTRPAGRRAFPDA
ncbi:MAG: hypothetical protein HY943_19500 [Gammaproteobacteria bacterium]|nr:hypothetical protein [Gammaproteobacteria bacterium]